MTWPQRRRTFKMTNSDQLSGNPPPSYEDATFLPGRQPPSSRPEPELTHTINIKASRASASAPLAIPFPADEGTWTSARDVQHADWERFVSNLAEARATKATKKDMDEGPPSDEQIMCMREAMALWNHHFFVPRGCKIQADGFEELKDTRNESMDFEKEGIKLKRVRGMFGLSFPGGNFLGLGFGRIS